MDVTPNMCPLCNRNGENWLRKNGHLIQVCVDCGHRFYRPPAPDKHVQMVYGDHYFANSSDGYLDYLGEEAIQRASALFYVSLLRPYMQEGAQVLDVGAACGYFLSEFQKQGWRCLGLEPNATMRAIGRTRFAVEIIDSSLDQLPSSQVFQLITAIQVVSHLIDPVAFAEQVYAKLSVGGLLLIETWDRHSLVARLTGSSWHELNPPSVLHWFSRDSLRKMFCSAGFEFVDTGLPRKRIQLGRAVHMLRHSGNHSMLSRCLTAPLKWVPERLSLPYFLGDAFWILLRKCR